jgi:hypothetical protein
LKDLESKGYVFEGLAENLVDIVWGAAKPAAPADAVKLIVASVTPIRSLSTMKSSLVHH